MDFSIYCLNDIYVNMFVINLGERLVCIDTGFSRANILKGFKSFNLDVSKVSDVFLTHSDFDHIANIGLFSQAKVYISGDELELINSKCLRTIFNNYGKLIKNYSQVANNTIININNVSFKAISTPGHTTGSMSYLLNDAILFTGDTILLKKGEAKPFYSIFNMDKNALKESITSLANLSNISMLITSHTGYTDNYDYAVKRKGL